MTPDELRIVEVLTAHPEGMAPHEVVAALDPPLHRKTVALILAKLVHTDIVRRSGHPRRSRYAIVTDAGERLAAAMDQWHKPPPPEPPDYSAL